MTRRTKPAPIVAVVNPISGGGAAERLWSQVAATLAQRGAREVSMVQSRSADHATEAAAQAAASGAITVAVGGDGQGRAVAEGVLTVDDAELAIAPAGRGNDLARHLGLPAEPAAIAEVILGGAVRTIDVLDVELPDGSTQIAVGNVYAGLDSVATELINKLRWMGPLAYRLAPVLTGLRWRPMTVRLTIDGVPREDRAHFVVVANSGDYGHGLRMVPTASVDSGRLEVMIVHGTVHAVRLAPVLSEAKTGTHIHRDQVEIVSATRVEMVIDRDVPVHSDGDFASLPPVSVSIRPRALPILVPR